MRSIFKTKNKMRNQTKINCTCMTEVLLEKMGVVIVKFKLKFVLYIFIWNMIHFSQIECSFDLNV